MDNILKSIDLYELLTCLTNASDLVSPEFANHHQQVAYLAYQIGKQLDLSKNQLKDLVLAGLLHDMGALSFAERLLLIESEPPTAQHHAIKGARLLERFAPLKGVADIVRFHHVPWNGGEGATFRGQPVPMLSHLLHLADRIAVMVNRKNYEIIGQVSTIRNRIIERKNTTFMPELVDAFVSISAQEFIWLDLTYKPSLNVMPKSMMFDSIPVDMDVVTDLTKIFASVIDFRSPFTANHTAGVAATAERLAKLAGFSENECRMMLIAGYLHDLGKLAIKNEVLEKPGRLNTQEFNAIRSHTYYTYRLLQPIRGFETINAWASFHHEKLNGKGYPFHLSGESIPLGSRIMAVADIFTAVSEDRPYRPGMSNGQVKNVFASMLHDGAVCPHVVSLLMDNYAELNDLRIEAQQKASLEYNYFLRSDEEEMVDKPQAIGE